MAVNINQLDQAVAAALKANPNATDAQIAATPGLTPPIVTARTGWVGPDLLIRLLGMDVCKILLDRIDTLIAAGKAQGATPQQQATAIDLKPVALMLGSGGFNLDNPATAPVLASLVAGGLLTQDQANAIATVQTWTCGQAVTEVDVAASRARVVAQQNFAAKRQLTMRACDAAQAAQAQGGDNAAIIAAFVARMGA